MSLFEQLRHTVDLRIPGFERSVPAGRVRQLALEQRDVAAWFDEFVGRLVASIGRRHLPVFRVSDGEFYFSVGYRVAHPAPGANPVVHYARQALSYVRWRRFDSFLSGTPTSSFEVYRGADWRRLRSTYVRNLREIAEDGILAMALFRTPERFAERYHRPICRWMDQHGIPVHRDNYYPFYFVYGLLNGPRRAEVLDGRSVLVVTSLDPGKQDRIEQGLAHAGVRRVQFLPISADGALRDRIDLDGLDGGIEVALVGAGVGAASVLTQLRELNTLCVDAGHCLDLLANPGLVGLRDFSRSDVPVLGAAARP